MPAGETTCSWPLAPVAGTVTVSEVPLPAIEAAATGASVPKATVVPGPKPPPVIVTGVPGFRKAGTEPVRGETDDTNGATSWSGKVNTPLAAESTMTSQSTLDLPGLMLALAASVTVIAMKPGPGGAFNDKGLNCTAIPAGAASATEKEMVPVTPSRTWRLKAVVAFPNAASTTAA
jgi:hypothetical protein